MAGPVALATVYEWGGSRRDLAEAVPQFGLEYVGPDRAANLNGASFRFRVARTRQSIEDVFTGYQRYFGTDLAHELPAEETAAGETDAAEGATSPASVGLSSPSATCTATDGCDDLPLEPDFRGFVAVQDEIQGFFVGLRVRSEQSSPWWLRVVDKLNGGAFSGTLGPFDDVLLVHAIRNEAEGLTTLVQATPGRNIRWERILPTGTEDVPGTDPVWLRRPERAVRLVAFEERSEIGGYALHAYGLSQPVPAVVAHLEASGLHGERGSDNGSSWVAQRNTGGDDPAIVTVVQAETPFASLMLVVEPKR